MWFIGVEVEKETSAPPPKKNPGSAPVRYRKTRFTECKKRSLDLRITFAISCDSATPWELHVMLRSPTTWQRQLINAQLIFGQKPTGSLSARGCDIFNFTKTSLR